MIFIFEEAKNKDFYFNSVLLFSSNNSKQVIFYSKQFLIYFRFLI
jgi:hypothetical protein